MSAPKVLVVEDEVMIHLMLEEAFRQDGFATAFATDASQAIKALEAPGADFRALVTDISLGRSLPTGWDVARRARALSPELAVVYLTGQCAADWVTDGVEHSVLLTKPFGLRDLVDAVIRLLNAPRRPSVEGH